MAFRKLTTALLGCALAAVLTTPAAAYAPFSMGIHEPNAGAGDAATFDQIRDANAQIARVTITWSSIAPNTSTKPAGMDARNPADPNYNWNQLDGFVRSARARGIEPLVTTYQAPNWAEGKDLDDRASRFGDPGTYHPNPGAYADFLHALATRYSGSYPDPANPGQSLPRVRYHQLWNEPNFGQYLTAKTKGEIPLYYARLLNAGYDALKAVNKSNIVLTAGLGPYGNNGHATDVEPQQFMRSLLCLTGTGGRKLRDNRRCRYPKPKFDIWTQHPYTFGGNPRTRAGHPDAASMGNMSDVKRTLDYAVRVRNVGGPGRKKLWVTEFGWFSNPPGITSGDGRQLGLPLSRQAAYLSETAYRLWRLRFEAFVWYGIGDHASFPSGLMLNGQPKPALAAFRFPFYADHSRRGVLVWGLVSNGGKTKVRIERRSGKRWKRVAVVTSDKRGMIYKRLRGNRGVYRAVALDGAKSGATSLSFKAR